MAETKRTEIDSVVHITLRRKLKIKRTRTPLKQSRSERR